MGSLSVVQRRSLERATETYGKYLDEAEAYLAGRGIDLAVARSVGMGVVRDPLPGQESRVGRLAIPYLTPSGTVNMTFRCIVGHDCKAVKCSKYKTWSGLSPNLYNVQALHDANQSIATTEGEIDALSSTLAGIPAVGISGVDKWQPHWKNIFEDFSRVYHWEDGDEAGKKLGDRMVSEVGAIRVRLPDGQDVNSIWVASGAEALRARIRK